MSTTTNVFMEKYGKLSLNYNKYPSFSVCQHTSAHVNHPVSFKISLLSKSSPTDLTTVRFLSSMGPVMGLQFPFIVFEKLATYTTAIAIILVSKCS